MSAFQLKDFISITAAMVNQVRASQSRITDFEVGSAIRTLLEAPAIEIEELYQRMLAGTLDAIPTAIYKAFGFDLVGPAAARGTVHVQFGGPIVEAFTIPSGTVFVASTSTGTLKFSTLDAQLVPVGATSLDVVVVCATQGAVGNVGANAITATEGYSFPIGSTLTNAAFTSGTDGQTESERKARFAEFIQSLSRGTSVSVRYAVKQAQIKNSRGDLIEYVSRVGSSEVPGRIDVYIYGSSGVPSAALLAAAQKIVDGYRDTDGTAVPGYVAGGVEGRVLPMAERIVNVSLHVTLMPGLTGTATMRNQIATLLAAQFDAVASGETLQVAQLTNAALTLSGVLKAVADNNANIVCGANEVLKLGTLTVEWLNA
jgi:hypothetical protein